MANLREVEILLVEDDDGHARLIEKNLRRSNISNHVTRFKDGQEAVNFFFGPNAAYNPQAAYLMLLDLNMPVMTGYQVLEQMKQSEKTRHIPVIILTTTEDNREVVKCYELGCNIYITKPIKYENFTEAIRKIGLFLSVVTVPELTS